MFDFAPDLLADQRLGDVGVGVRQLGHQVDVAVNGVTGGSIPLAAWTGPGGRAGGRPAPSARGGTRTRRANPAARRIAVVGGVDRVGRFGRGLVNLAEGRIVPLVGLVVDVVVHGGGVFHDAPF